MHTVILFRGGMFGDIILSMLDKNYVRSVYPLKQKKQRYLMKKFQIYSHQQKMEYFKKMDGYTLSHDTDFCKTIDQDQVVQIYCSDLSMMEEIASRFWSRNHHEDVSHVKDDLELNETYTLADDLTAWQNHHVFKKRFDVKKIYDVDFASHLEQHFDVRDMDWARCIHSIWLGNQ